MPENFAVLAAIGSAVRSARRTLPSDSPTREPSIDAISSCSSGKLSMVAVF
ncbi:MAG: hypothetical protein V7K30_14430 [Nostoc sp.]